jgi:hypothetical protein
VAACGTTPETRTKSWAGLARREPGPRVLPAADLEPPVGIEPTTCSLRAKVVSIRTTANMLLRRHVTSRRVQVSATLCGLVVTQLVTQHPPPASSRRDVLARGPVLGARGPPWHSSSVTTRFNTLLFDALVAPGASQFNEAEIPDIQGRHENRRFWVDHLFLNSVLSPRYKGPLNAYATAFLRRVEGAFTMHDLARDATRTLLSLTQISPSHYARTLLHWEGFLAQAAQAHSVLLRTIRHIIKDETFKFYEQDDGSVEQRLNAVHNALKHVEKRINNNQVLPDSVSPVWMTNEGLRSTDVLLTWTETGEVLDELAHWADGLQNPSGFGAWFREQVAGRD